MQAKFKVQNRLSYIHIYDNLFWTVNLSPTGLLKPYPINLNITITLQLQNEIFDT